MVDCKICEDLDEPEASEHRKTCPIAKAALLFQSTPEQDAFDMDIGRLDWILSRMMLYSKDATLSDENKQTVKHHAEDMVAAGNAILKKLGKVEGTPQPSYNPFG